MVLFIPWESTGERVKEWTVDKQFSSMSDLKSGMGGRPLLNVYVHGYEFDTGYIITGHSMKGKLNQVNSDGDIATLYAEFAHRKCLLFWIKCLAKPKK